MSEDPCRDKRLPSLLWGHREQPCLRFLRGIGMRHRRTFELHQNKLARSGEFHQQKIVTKLANFTPRPLMSKMLLRLPNGE